MGFWTDAVEKCAKNGCANNATFKVTRSGWGSDVVELVCKKHLPAIRSEFGQYPKEIKIKELR